jgi:NADH dehydrogenase
VNITIIGGGFGGVKSALQLSKNKKNKITLISDKPDFQYYPALYGTATGYSHLQSWVSLGVIFADKENVTVIIDEIEFINKKPKTLVSSSGITYNYETLIISIGVVTTYFGIDGLESYAYGIKSYQEIRRLKKHLYSEFSKDGVVDKEIVIVGAGATGVELSSALGEYLERLRKHYKRPKSKTKIRINLVEAAPRVMPKMSEKASKKIAKRLRKLKIKLQLSKKVESATVDQIMVSGKSIKSHTLIWTSGVTNHPFFKNNAKSFELAPNGKVVVDEFLKSDKDIYVIGDNAATPYSGLAQTALHDAIYVAKNINSKNPKKYKAKMPPVVIPVGKRWAVLEWKSLVISGWLGYIIRRMADFVGYRDILPIGQSLSAWHAQNIKEDDYFSPKD